MLEQHSLDLGRVHVDSAGDDEVLAARGQIQVVVAEPSEVPGGEHVAPPPLVGSLRVAPVLPLRERRSRDVHGPDALAIGLGDLETPSTACPAHCIDIVAAPSPWPDREKYPETFVIDELRCIYCGMCEEACPVDAVELTTLFDLTGLSREEMMFDKEKLLSVFDQTAASAKDPIRTKGGALSCASEPNVGGGN